MKKLGTLFVIAAPSGAGKTSLVNALVKLMPTIKLSISYTTRAKRAGEIHGVHYFFVDSQKFDAMVKAGEFLEHATVFGRCYGTSRQWVETELRSGNDVILEIDWQGAAQIRQSGFENVSIFILPPSRAVLEERLRQRGQDNDKIIAERMAAASSEMAHCHEFDQVIVNDDFSVALQALQKIVQAKRNGEPCHYRLDHKLLAELLKKE